MSNINAVLDLQRQTSAQQARDAETRRQDALAGRNVNNAMGKHDFLMLLVAQLRNQNPLEPQNDNEFASQLANFAQLEQLENLNNSMQDMARQQAFGLIGKFVIGEDTMGNEIAGIVESVFVRRGELFATLSGHEVAVTVASIRDVFDTGEFITPRMLIEISNSIVGRYVKAEYYRDPEEDSDETRPVLFEIQGVVERVAVDEGQIFAYIRNEIGEITRVPVGAIFDIGAVHVPVPVEAAIQEPEPQCDCGIADCDCDDEKAQDVGASGGAPVADNQDEGDDEIVENGEDDDDEDGYEDGYEDRY